LAQKYPAKFKYISVGEPNYGSRAFAKGLRLPGANFILCDEIDLCDVEFQSRAVEMLASNAADFVIGSKLIGGAKDDGH